MTLVNCEPIAVTDWVAMFTIKRQQVPLNWWGRQGSNLRPRDYELDLVLFTVPHG